MKSSKINLTLSPQEIEFIISALSKFPYEQVCKLISNVALQAKELDSKSREKK